MSTKAKINAAGLLAGLNLAQVMGALPETCGYTPNGLQPWRPCTAEEVLGLDLTNLPKTTAPGFAAVALGWEPLGTGIKSARGNFPTELNSVFLDMSPKFREDIAGLVSGGAIIGLAYNDEKETILLFQPKTAEKGNRAPIDAMVAQFNIERADRSEDNEL